MGPEEGTFLLPIIYRDLVYEACGTQKCHVAIPILGRPLFRWNVFVMGHTAPHPSYSKGGSALAPVLLPLSAPKGKISVSLLMFLIMVPLLLPTSTGRGKNRSWLPLTLLTPLEVHLTCWTILSKGSNLLQPYTSRLQDPQMFRGDSSWCAICY